MTRRDWMVALASGLGLGLVSGCTRATGLQPATVPTLQQTTGSVALQPPPEAAQPLSPYRVVPATPPRADAPVFPDSTNASAPPDAPADARTSGSDPNIRQVQTNPARDDEVRPAIDGTPPQLATDSPLEARPELQPNLDEPAVVHALHYLLNKRPADAIRMLKQYDQETQEILLCLLPLAARLSEESIKKADANEMAIWVDQLETVVGPLRRQASLGLDKMCFCRRVDRFGVYEPLPGDHQFRPGDMVQIYVELRNFTCELHGAVYETQLASSVCLKRDDRVEWEQGFPDRFQPDRSQSQRHDYFNNYRFQIPPNLPLGEYTLWLEVKDLATNPPRGARCSLPLRLTTRPGM